MTHDEIIAQVRKLYALADGNASEHEAAAAVAAAERLIQKHRLSVAEIEADDASETVSEGEHLDEFGEQIPAWKGWLQYGLAKAHGCYSLQSKRAIKVPHLDAIGGYTWKRVSFFRVFGRPSDVAFLRLQYGRIVEQVERLTYENARGRGRTYADSYRKGIVITVLERVKEATRDARAGASETAIVRVDARLDASERFAQANVQGIRASKGRRTLNDPAAFARGREDGRHVHFGESLAAGGRVRALPAKGAA